MEFPLILLLTATLAVCAPTDVVFKATTQKQVVPTNGLEMSTITTTAFTSTIATTPTTNDFKATNQRNISMTEALLLEMSVPATIKTTIQTTIPTTTTSMLTTTATPATTMSVLTEAITATYASTVPPASLPSTTTTTSNMEIRMDTNTTTPVSAPNTAISTTMLTSDTSTATNTRIITTTPPVHSSSSTLIPTDADLTTKAPETLAFVNTTKSSLTEISTATSVTGVAAPATFLTNRATAKINTNQPPLENSDISDTKKWYSTALYTTPTPWTITTFSQIFNSDKVAPTVSLTSKNYNEIHDSTTEVVTDSNPPYSPPSDQENSGTIHTTLLPVSTDRGVTELITPYSPRHDQGWSTNSDTFTTTGETITKMPYLPRESPTREDDKSPTSTTTDSAVISTTEMPHSQLEGQGSSTDSDAFTTTDSSIATTTEMSYSPLENQERSTNINTLTTTESKIGATTKTHHSPLDDQKLDDHHFIIANLTSAENSGIVNEPTEEDRGTSENVVTLVTTEPIVEATSGMLYLPLENQRQSKSSNKQEFTDVAIVTTRDPKFLYSPYKTQDEAETTDTTTYSDLSFEETTDRKIQYPTPFEQEDPGSADEITTTISNRRSQSSTHQEHDEPESTALTTTTTATMTTTTAAAYDTSESTRNTDSLSSTTTTATTTTTTAYNATSELTTFAEQKELKNTATTTAATTMLTTTTTATSNLTIEEARDIKSPYSPILHSADIEIIITTTTPTTTTTTDEIPNSSEFSTESEKSRTSDIHTTNSPHGFTESASFEYTTTSITLNDSSVTTEIPVIRDTPSATPKIERLLNEDGVEVLTGYSIVQHN